MTAPTPRFYGPATVRDDGHITPPKALRDDVGIETGDQIRFFAWGDEKRVLMVIGDVDADATAEFFREVLHFPPG